MGLSGKPSSRPRRPTENERIVGQCRALWVQRGLSGLKIKELCEEAENDLEEAAEAGYGPEAIVGSSVREFAEQMAEENAPPRRRAVTAYKVVLIALVSACGVLVPQHVLLGSWSVPVGWTKIYAMAAIFSTICLLRWHKFSSSIYIGRKGKGVSFAGGVLGFCSGVLINMTFGVYELEPTGRQILVWPWWASLAAICLTVLVSRLHGLCSIGPVSPQLGAEQKRDGPRGSDKVALGFASVAFVCNLIAWTTSEGLSKDWSALMVVCSSLLLAMILPAFRKRESGPTAFE